MKKSSHYLIKFGCWLGELLTLPMFYSATLLDPFPFDKVRISMIGLTGSVSCAFAYVSSCRFKDRAVSSRLTVIEILAKPPMVIWITIFMVIVLQLIWGLIMMHLAARA